MTVDAHTTTLKLPPLVLPREALAARLRVANSARKRDDLFAMIDTVESLARPAAYYRRVRPAFEGEDVVVLDGQRIQSPTLRKVLAGALPLADGSEAVFPFAATCGQELTDWGSSQELGLRTYWAQVILEQAIQMVTRSLENELHTLRGDAELSTIEPGIPADWLLDRQGELFQVLGGKAEDFDIRLNEQSLMLPFHYLAGIYFFTKQILMPCGYCHFVDCDRQRGGCWRFQALKNRVTPAPEAAPAP